MNKLSKCIAEAIGTFCLIFIGIGAGAVKLKKKYI